MSQRPGFDGNPFLIWILANMLGFGFLGIALLVSPSLMEISGLWGSTLIVSIPISIAQWIALRRIIPVPVLWVLTLPVSVLVVILLPREIPQRFWQFVPEFLAGFIFPYLVIGFLIGLPQWIILRRHLDKASIWLLGSSIGVALSAGVAIDTGLVNLSGITAYIIAVLVYASATGLALIRLLSYHGQSQTTVVSAT